MRVSSWEGVPAPPCQAPAPPALPNPPPERGRPQRGGPTEHSGQGAQDLTHFHLLPPRRALKTSGLLNPSALEKTGQDNGTKGQRHPKARGRARQLADMGLPGAPSRCDGNGGYRALTLPLAWHSDEIHLFLLLSERQRDNPELLAHSPDVHGGPARS